MNRNGLVNRLKNHDMVFVTGITGTGKSVFAKNICKEIDKEYCNFDMNWYYGIETSKSFIEKIKFKNNLVIDGIPFGEDNFYHDFIEYTKNVNVCVVCIYFDNLKFWFRNILNKKYSYLDYNINYFYTSWEIFYLQALVDLLKNVDNIYFYNVNTNKVHDNYNEIKKIFEKLLEEINKCKGKGILENYLYMLNKEDEYDALYQDVEAINFIGYSKSYLTWNVIKDLFDYKDKIVVDLGCFHGYFSFKFLNSGAKFVYGLDISERVLDFCNILKNVYGKGDIEFWKWNENCALPKNIDLLLVLNVLHHFKYPDIFLKNIKEGVYVIFEIEKSQKNLVDMYFSIIKICDSYRVDESQDRMIMLAVKN